MQLPPARTLLGPRHASSKQMFAEPTGPGYPSGCPGLYSAAHATQQALARPWRVGPQALVVAAPSRLDQPAASARTRGDLHRDLKRRPRALLVVRFPLRTIASSRVRHLKVEPPGATDRPVSDLLFACLEVLGVVVRTIRLAFEHPHFYSRAALRRSLQHELVALRRGNATHRASRRPATRAPATLERTLPAIAKPVMLIVRRLVADNRPGPPWGVDHPIQPEGDSFGRRLLVYVDYGNGMYGDLKLEDKGIAWEGLRRWQLLIKRTPRSRRAVSVSGSRAPCSA